MVPITIVTKDNVDSVFDALSRPVAKGFDTETTGKGYSDMPFILTISTLERAYLFDFRVEDPSIVNEIFLMGEMYGFNAKFDIQMLWKVGISAGINVHCGHVAARLIRNDYMAYSLEAVAKRHGLEKDGRVEAYIKEHGLYAERYQNDVLMDKVPQFYKVPNDIMYEYAPKDAWLHLKIGLEQRERINKSIQ